ncbi:hypothetical protein [Microcystis phage Mae-JY04]|nr:hypothetical protein [Blastomonas sp.]
MDQDRAPPNGSATADPPAPIAAALLLGFLFFWLPLGIAATIWWFK